MQFKITVFFLACFAWFALGQTQLTLNVPTDLQTLSAGQAGHYTFVVPENISVGNDYLIFDVIGAEDSLYDPDIFISNNPTLTNSEWRCTAYGQDICVIPKEAVAHKKTFYASMGYFAYSLIAVYCQQKCVYRLVVKASSEYELKESERVTDYLSATQTRIYKFFVPPDTGIHSIGVNLDLAGNSSMVRMFVTIDKDGTTQPSSANSMQVLPSWFGLNARVYDDNPYLFCRNCTYKVLVNANEDTMYMLHYYTSKSVTKIKESQYQSYEVVHSGERNCYEYFVKDSSDIFEVYLNTFSGDPDIYVNPQTLPEKNSDFALSSKGGLDEVLSITPEQRRKLGAVTGTYYICIYGTRPSSYSLTIGLSKEGENEKTPIYSGLTRTAYVKKGKLKVFEYVVLVPEKTNLTFTLTSLSGNADLYIKYCVEELNDFGSPVTPCELHKDQLDANDVLKSEEYSSADVLTIQYDPKMCADPKKRCSYLVGVLGRKKSRFSLSILGDPQDETPIAEGQAYFGYVGLRQSNYYSFVITDPETTSVKLQLTSLSGDADLYVSRSHPSGRIGSERYSNQASFLPDAIYFDKERDGPLNTSYHITIYGHTAATFTITYTATVPGGDEKAILLANGLPQSGIINGTTKETASKRYYFYTSFSKNEKQDIGIYLTPLTGTYNMYIGVNYLPTSENYTWSMGKYDHSLQIFASDSSYRRKGKYNILIVKDEVSDVNPYIFSIKYTTEEFTTNIVEGQPEMGNLTRGEIIYYKYNVITYEGSITVTVTPFSGDPDLYVSINSTNNRPDLMNNDYMSAAIGPDSIKIPVTEVLQKTPGCSFSLYVSSTCAVYIGVKCASEVCSYSLQVGRSKELVIQLLDGMPQFGTTAGGDPQYYLYTPGNMTDSTVISFYPKKGKIKAYAKLVPWDVTDPVKPTPETHTIASSTRANTEVLEITEWRAIDCGWLCRYYIGVFSDASQSMPGETLDSEFTIVATSGIRQLIEGQTVVDYVGEKVYKYYRFEVPCSDCVLTISVTPLSAGDPDIFINRDKLRLPNNDNADYKAISYRGDILQISPNDPLIVESPTLMRGTFLIGIYGSQNCTYSLTATTSTSIIQDITQGIPIRQEQAQGKINYYIFYCWKKANIVISLAMHSGRATIRANVATSVHDASVLDQLPVSETKSKWSSLRSNTVNYLVIDKNDPAYQEYGIYLIGVEAEETSNYDISVEYESNEDYKLLRVSEAYRVHVREGEVKKYKFEITSKENINVQINLFYGAIGGSVTTDPSKEPKWKMKRDTGLVIKKSDPKFAIGTYYLKIEGKQESDFSIMVVQNLHLTWLSEGLPQKAEIEHERSTYFFYSIPRNIKARDLRLNVYATFKGGNVINPTMYIRHITRIDSSMPNTFARDYEAIWDPDLKQLGVSVSVDTKKSQTLAIAVAGNLADSARKGEFNIMAWTTGFALLMPDHLYTNKFSTLNDMHVYELSLKRASRFYIEVIPCIGEVEFFVTKNLASIADRKYDLKKTELSKGKLFGSVQDPEGTYYISVRALDFSRMEKDKDKGIQYTIKAIISNETTAANLEDFGLESYGNIDTYLDGNELVLSWGRPYLRGSQDKKMVRAKYSIYMSEDSGANMYTICGIKYGGATKIASDISTQSFKYNIREKRSIKKLSFNVIGKIEEYQYTVAYNPVVFQVPKPPRMSRFYVIAMIVLVLLLGGVAVYFWRKYKSAMKRLEYEMNDVRNLGNISTVREVPAGKAETYLHLRSGTED